MSTYLPATLGIAVMLIASTAVAKERSALESASVKAATDCIAAVALNNPKITTLYRENRLNEVTDWIVLRSSACDNPLRAMRLLHDRLYGQGTGQVFLRGDYLADLPRAVGERIKVAFGAEARAPLPPSTLPPSALNEGDKLRVVNIGANDVLNMRRDGTANSPIVYGIPPNTEGIIYLGEAQGQWILVRYENRAEGWVHRDFVQPVQPVPSRGRLLR
jgi:uncharacterized protein YgiM (DUF1202 family)